MRKLLLLAMFTSGVMANSTLYIGDKVKIPMRLDDSITKGNIITRLGVDTPVTLIKKQSNGWSHVEYQDKHGWIISRYLTSDNPSKPSNGKVKQQAQQISKLKQVVVELEQALNQQQQSVSALKTESAKYNTQALELNKLHKKISSVNQINADLNTQVKSLKSQNAATHITDFLNIISTLMLFVGLAVGYLMSRAKANRNNIYRI